jgi:predicted PurR-regulated permease PerM
MTEKNVLFYAIVIALVYLAYAMFSPFILAIFSAVVFSIVLLPVYEFISIRFKNANIAATVVVLIALLLFVAPLSYFGYLLVAEIKVIISLSGGKDILAIIIENNNLKTAVAKMAQLLNIPPDKLYSYLIWLIGAIKTGLTRIVSENALVAINAVMDYFIMLFTLFFLLRDRKAFVSAIRRLLPLSEIQKEHLITRIDEVIVSTMYGGVMIALAAGVIGGVAFNFLGVPSPLLLGFAMSVFSFIPIVGSFAVWGPVTAYLFISGEIMKGVIMAAVGIVVIVGLVEHILKPKIMGQRARIHTALIFFGVLGGIHLFGVIGFVAGPLIIAVLMMAMPLIEKKLEQ